MGRDLNKVQLTGRLGQDPEIRITPQGTTLTTFTIATGRRYTDSQGNQREDTEWTPITARDKLGEICGEYLRKGARVYAEGRLQTRSWEDQETGQKRSKTEVVASDVIFLDRRQDVPAAEGEGEAPAAPPTRPAPAAQPMRGVTPRGRMATITPATDDDGTDDLPF